MRKTPVLLRRGPLSGDVNALLRYTRRTLPNGREVIQSSDKQDISRDYYGLLCEELFGPDDDSPDIIGILDGVADGELLTADEKAQVRAFRERFRAAVERHNALLGPSSAGLGSDNEPRGEALSTREDGPAEGQG